MVQPAPRLPMRLGAGGITVTLPEYTRRLALAARDLHAALHSSGGARVAALQKARAALDAIVQVRVGGHAVRVDLAPIVRDLAAGRLGDGLTRLEALRAALFAQAAPLSPAPFRGRGMAQLDRILAAPPFTATPSIWTWIGDLVRRLTTGGPIGALLGLLARLLRALGDVNGDAVYPITVAIAGLVIAAAAIFFFTHFTGGLAPYAAVERAGDVTMPVADAASARARSLGLAASGAYREAARYLYLATLLALDESGRLSIDSAAGNREILSRARAEPSLAAALLPVVRDFERHWFGHHEMTREEYDLYCVLTERVLEPRS